MTTTLPLESHQNTSLFLEHAEYIGRAYRNQALELISICQLLSQIVSPQCVHEDAELRRSFRACDIALRSGADSGSKVTDEANARFKEATQVLNSYSERREPFHDTAFPLNVSSRMEIAKQKDSAKSVWSHVAKRATLLLPKSKDEQGPRMTINFVLLRSPILTPGDPDTIIVSQVFNTSPSLPEILWNFSRYEDRARITLEQNPHFYLHCPVDESEYTPMFQYRSLQGPSLALEHNGTVYVLLDGPIHVFLDIERNLRIFGNVWSLNSVLIFKDRFGVLEGEELVRGSSVRGDLRYCEQQVILNDHKYHSKLNHRCLRPIVTTSSAARPAGGKFEAWLALNRQTSPSISIHIYGSKPGGFPESINSLDLPPPPPTSELPRYPVQYTTINTLNDDVLFFVFNYYRLDEENGWNAPLGWCKLTHVCRKWRHLLHFSAFRLGMHILCTNGNPMVDTLDHLLTIPLFIDYQDAIAPITQQDEFAIHHALLLRDRVRRIDLHLPPSSLHMFLPLMDGPFSMLEYLSLSYTDGGDPTLVLPKTFLAPNLRQLTLFGINIPNHLQLLFSTASLVTLVLTDIRASGYFLPGLLVARLQSLPHLETFSIRFFVLIPHPSTERELSGKQGATVTLPNLKNLAFQGVSAYLDCLVAQIKTPLLERVDITLFHETGFELPCLSHFTNTIEGLKFPIANISFGHDMVSVITDYHDSRWYNGRFALHVMYGQIDWQIDCAARICNTLMPALLGVEELRLKFREQMMPTEWENGGIDGRMWHRLLRVFVGVKELHICAALSQELSRALQVGDVGSDPGLLPGLREIVSEFKGRVVKDLFSSFIRARQIVGHPVRYSPPTCRAKARFAYTASPDDPNEISFSRGEILDIVDNTGKWWQAEKEDGTAGIVPSNFLKMIERQQSASFSNSFELVPSINVQNIERLQSARSSNSSDRVPCRARALYAYTASEDDPNEISFSTGEILDIINRNGNWWQARKGDGTVGIAPSNFLLII